MSFLALRSASFDPRLNLALEETLLGAEGLRCPCLFLYVDDPCLVVGRNQNPWVEVSPSSELQVLRRVSGGGTVYHDRGNLNWALIVPRSGHDPSAELARVAAALARLGLESRAGERGGLYVELGPGEGRGKVSGTARRLEASRVLHHGTLLVEADLGLLSACLGGLRPAFSRGLPSVPARPVNLAGLRPGLGVAEVAGALFGEFCEGAAPRDAEAAASELAGPRAVETAARRLGSWDWTYGQTPPFSVRLEAPAGPLDLELRSGCLAAVEGPGATSLDLTDLKSLLGSRFDYCLPERIALLYKR